MSLTDVDATAGEWEKMTADFSYEQMSNALVKYIRSDESGFAPTIGKLINLAKDTAVYSYILGKQNTPLITTDKTSYKNYKVMDNKKIVEMFACIKAYYGSCDYDSFKIAMWAELFEGCDYDAIMFCLKKYAKTNSFPPAPAGILTLYSEGKEKLKQGMQYEYDTVYQELYEVIHRDKIEENVAMFKFTVGQISEMDRLQVTQRLVRDLRQHLEENAEKYRNEEFNFEEWLKENF